MRLLLHGFGDCCGFTIDDKDIDVDNDHVDDGSLLVDSHGAVVVVAGWDGEDEDRRNV